MIDGIMYWGVLSSSNFAFKSIVPAIKKSKYSEVLAVSSRDKVTAEKKAIEFDIPKFYDNYDDLISDPEIDAVYIPLPNSMHLEWIKRSLEAGKHVLCEKPITLNYDEAVKLKHLSAAFPELKLMEAFMYRFHPQWETIKELLRLNTIGDIKYAHSHFSYNNVDGSNIRNRADVGGGALLDIGCYCISFARYVFDSEPIRAFGLMEFDPTFKTDRFTSGTLTFPTGNATFSCGTQMPFHQEATIIGSLGKIKMDIPFTPAANQKAKFSLYVNERQEDFVFDEVDHYVLEVDNFALSVINNTDVPTSLDDAVFNMKAIEGIAGSAKLNKWINLPGF